MRVQQRILGVRKPLSKGFLQGSLGPLASLGPIFWDQFLLQREERDSTTLNLSHLEFTKGHVSKVNEHSRSYIHQQGKKGSTVAIDRPKPFPYRPQALCNSTLVIRLSPPKDDLSKFQPKTQRTQTILMATTN